MGNIAIDDVAFIRGGSCEYFNSTTTTQATTTLFPPTDLKCDFETNLCNWIDVDTATSTRWTRKNGNTAVFGTAPLNDVTLQNSLGYYAIAYSTNIGQIASAYLKSPSISYKKETCLEFWYQLGIPFNSGLIIALKSDSNRTELWKRNGNKADIWSHAYVRIPNNLTNNWIEFEANMSNTLNGYAAIDDIQIILDSCPVTQFCDFESPNICNYQHDVNANFKWERFKGKTSSLQTGPEFDHTYQTAEGYYMYIKSRSPQRQNDTARLITEKVKTIPGGICLNFWYLAYGKTVGQLNVYTKKGDELSENPVWSIRGEQGSQWKVAAITIKESQDFEV